MAEIAGLKLITPTSVAGSGVSVSASGKVTFTSAGTISVNGCFTSSYDNYLIVLRGFMTAFAAELEFRMRASGSDDSSSNYARQRMYVDNTTATGLRQTEPAGRFSAFGPTLTNGVHAYIYGPALAQPTVTRGVAARSDGPAFYEWVSTHSLSTSYDGFTIITGSLNGALCVYGLSQ